MKKTSIIKSIPQTLNDRNSWNLSRRSFVKASLIAGMASQIAFISSCLENKTDSSPLSSNQLKILQQCQEILFPSLPPGPGALEVNADKYVLWVLNDPRMDPEENVYLINGLDWVEEEARELHGKSFTKLNEEIRKEVIAQIAEKSWGESWLSMNLTYIFEAMLSDPIYGFNIESVGWEWLNHTPGMPRPDDLLKYDEIFNTIKSNV